MWTLRRLVFWWDGPTGAAPPYAPVGRLVRVGGSARAGGVVAVAGSAGG